MDERKEQEMLRKYANHGTPLEPYDLREGVMYIVENMDDHVLRLLTFSEDAYHNMDLLILQRRQDLLDLYGPRYRIHAMEMIMGEGPEGAFFDELGDEPVAYRDLEWEEPYQIVIPRFYEYEQARDAYETEHERRKQVLSRSKGLFPVSEDILKYLLKPKKSTKKSLRKIRKTKKSVKRK